MSILKCIKCQRRCTSEEAEMRLFYNGLCICGGTLTPVVEPGQVHGLDYSPLLKREAEAVFAATLLRGYHIHVTVGAAPPVPESPLSRLIDDAARAEEMFGVDECEEHVEMLRRKNG